MLVKNTNTVIKVELTDSPIVREKSEVDSATESGAVIEFLGVVRGTEEGEAIEGISYEAYQGMAIRKMEEILNALAERISINEAHVVHRYGWVPVGEASLYISVKSAHRKEAFKFCDEFIDELKKDVPIWKASFENGDT